MDDEIQLKDIIAVINRYKWLIIFGTVLTVALSLIVTLQLPKIYEANTQILVSVKPLKRQTLEDMYYGTLLSEKLTNTFSQIAGQKSLLKKAAAQAHASYKKANVTAEVVSRTQLFNIKVEYPGKKEASLLANNLSKLVIKSANQASKKIKSGFKPELTVAEAASLPEQPIKPRLKLNLAFSFVIGLLATLTLAFIINSFSQPEPAKELNLSLEAKKPKAKAKL